MANTFLQAGPLDSKLPIVDQLGRPTAYFLQQWQRQRNVIVTVESVEANLTAIQTSVDQLVAQTISGSGGITGGGRLDSATGLVLSLTDTGVIAGTYGNEAQVARITVDGKGRVTGVTEVDITGAGGGGGVPTSRQIIAGTGLSGGGDLSADRTLNLTNTGVTSGNYGSASQVPQFTVDAQGRITSVTEVTVSSGGSGGVPTSRQIIAGTGLSGGGDLSADRTLNLTNTGVTANTYGSASLVPQITVDAQGRITGVTEVTVSSSGGGGGGTSLPPILSYYGYYDGITTDAGAYATKGILFKPAIDMDVRGVFANHRTSTSVTDFGAVVAEVDATGASATVQSVLRTEGTTNTTNFVAGADDYLFVRFGASVTLTAGNWYFIGISRRNSGGTAGWTAVHPSSSADSMVIGAPGETDPAEYAFASETLSVSDVVDYHNGGVPFIVLPLF